MKHLFMKYAVITLDLEPDYAGHVPDRYDGWEAKRINEVLHLLRQRHIPLSVFVVGNMLSKRKDTIRQLRAYRTDFHLHSFSHSLKFPDSANEIERGIRAYYRCFGKKPVGYRAPEGRISVGGWSMLNTYGFQFDSSVFPSFWPRPKYLKYPQHPFKVPETSLWEIPFATISTLRFIVSLSWIKMLGWGFYSSCIGLFGLPDIVVFNLHLHDLWVLPSYDSLPVHWKLLYRRNHSRSFEYLSDFLVLLKQKGYTFTTISQVARSLGK